MGSTMTVPHCRVYSLFADVLANVAQSVGVEGL